MKTGRELDALVAEKVMGWTWETIVTKKYLIPPQALVEIQEIWNKSTGYREIKIPIPPYSSDISAAWEVVEKFIKFNPFWEEKDSLCFNLTPTKPPGWYCNFGDSNTDVYADTAPMAISLAALKAVGVEI